LLSTDIPNLPDLNLLRHRESLAATLDTDEWAKTEAMPAPIDEAAATTAKCRASRRKPHPQCCVKGFRNLRPGETSLEAK
jgi:hypothetical protein